MIPPELVTISQADLQSLKDNSELLNIQLWIFGGLVVALLGLVVYFSKASWEEVKMIIREHDEKLDQHGNRLTAIETAIK